MHTGTCKSHTSDCSQVAPNRLKLSQGTKHAVRFARVYGQSTIHATAHHCVTSLVFRVRSRSLKAFVSVMICMSVRMYPLRSHLPMLKKYDKRGLMKIRPENPNFVTTAKKIARGGGGPKASFTVTSDKNSPRNRYLPAKLYQAIR